MKNDTWEKFAAIAGVASVICFFVGWFIYGKGPTVADSPETILQFFKHNHDRVIWSMFVQGVGAMAMILFMAALVIHMRAANEKMMAYTAGLSFAIALAIGSLATIMRSGIAFISIGDIPPATATVIFHLGSVIDTSQNIFSSGFFFAVAVASIRSSFMPSWWGWLSVVAGVWAVATTTALDHTGFWSPQEAGFWNLVAYVIWVGGTSILLYKRINSSAT